MFKKCLAGLVVFSLTACSLQDIPFIGGDKGGNNGSIADLMQSMPEESMLISFNKTESMSELLGDTAKAIKKITSELEDTPEFESLDLEAVTQQALPYLEGVEPFPLEEFSLLVALKPGASFNLESPEKAIEQVCVRLNLVSTMEGFDDLVNGVVPMIESIGDSQSDFSINKSSGSFQLNSNCSDMVLPELALYQGYDFLFAEKQFFTAVQAIVEDLDLNDEAVDSSIVSMIEKLQSQLEGLNFNKVRLGTIGQVIAISIHSKGYQTERFELLSSSDLQDLRYDFWEGRAQTETYYLHEAAGFEPEVSKESDNAVYTRYRYDNLDWTHVVSLLQKQGLGGILIMSAGAGLTAGVATLTGYLSKAKDAEKQAAVRNAATIMKTARAVDTVASFSEDTNGDGRFTAADIEKTLREEGGYSMPSAQDNKCYFYGYKGDESDDFVVIVGKARPEQTFRGSAYVFMDGTADLIGEVSRSINGPINCTAPRVSGVNWINLSEGSSASTMNLSSRSGGVISPSDNPSPISLNSSLDNAERQMAVRTIAALVLTARAIDSMTSFKEDVNNDGQFGADDIKQILLMEGGYRVPNIVGDQCYFYMVSDANDDEFAVFIGTEDQEVLVDGTSKMVQAARTLFDGKSLNCELPTIPGGTVLNLSQ
jgi:hypothetical protein